MAQRAEAAAVRVIIGDGPDARDVVAERQPEAAAVLRFLRRNEEFCLLFAAKHRQNDRLSLLKVRAEALRRADGVAIRRKDRVPGLKPGSLRGHAVGDRRYDQSARI